MTDSEICCGAALNAIKILRLQTDPRGAQISAVKEYNTAELDALNNQVANLEIEITADGKTLTGRALKVKARKLLEANFKDYQEFTQVKAIDVDAMRQKAQQLLSQRFRAPCF
eukprot:gnl/MRDRNA2_/MRDRNA2_34524_c0_seq1.p2 gnl/MRDRNA2_/MRDRNA2_34524_c0~~gnl/MRDRNA2_/MRDRNA2_34524_c0_seq1.p2  ORF type:complete len:113 (-),score=27.95 gnl/MRDRNA2_/MRDRNA2_34524_c0_seq1:108-446(-)